MILSQVRPLAALFLGAWCFLSPQMASAQQFAPVVVVNDEIITGYEVDQRVRLIDAASGGAAGTASYEQALEQLIDDRLKLQAAKAAGIVPGAEEINAGFDDLARLNGSDSAAARRFFASRGVSDEALNSQIASEVAWRSLIRQRYLPRVRVSDAELNEAVGASAGKTTETEYLISEIRLPIDASGEQAAMSRGADILRRLSSGATFGDVARELSRGPTAAVGGDLGWVTASSLSPKSAQVVSALRADRVSAPYVDGSDVVLTGLRRIRQPGAQSPTRYRLAQLVVGVDANAPQAVADQALQQAQIARSQVTDCASVEALKSQYLPISGDLGEMTNAEMPGPVRDAVITLGKGDISQPVRSNDGFHIIVVCDKIESASASDDAKVRLRNRMTAQKLARFSSGLLRDLRREAVIERR